MAQCLKATEYIEDSAGPGERWSTLERLAIEIKVSWLQEALSRAGK